MISPVSLRTIRGEFQFFFPTPTPRDLYFTPSVFFCSKSGKRARAEFQTNPLKFSFEWQLSRSLSERVNWSGEKNNAGRVASFRFIKRAIYPIKCGFLEGLLDPKSFVWAAELDWNSANMSGCLRALFSHVFSQAPVPKGILFFFFLRFLNEAHTFITHLM